MREGKDVPDELSSIIEVLVKKLGDADLNSLLDYVYFDTEPMENARRGEVLDFTHLTAVAKAPSPKFDEAKLKTIRTRIERRANSMALTRKGVHIPAVDPETQAAWNEDDRRVALEIGARVKFS
jgi:hypothetical protein